MKVVDHEERRHRIAEAAIDLIANEGLSAATVRRIAAEVGFSTMAVTHYFSDKQELVFWTFRVLAKQGDDRFEEALAEDPTDLAGSLLTMTAHDESTRRRWRGYLAFWDQAARDPVFAAEHHAATQAGLANIARVIRARNPELTDVSEASQLLSAAVQGISLQAVIDEQNWTADKVRRLLAIEIDKVLGPPDARH